MANIQDRSWKSRVGMICVYAILILFTVLAIYPLIWLTLNSFNVNRYACRHAINHTSYCRSVRLAECAQAKYFSKTVSHIFSLVGKPKKFIYFSTIISATEARTYFTKSAGAIFNCKPLTPALT